MSRRRGKREIYDPQQDIELKRLEDNTKAHKKRDITERPKGFESTSVGKFVCCVWKSVENSKLLELINAADVLTGYKPFNLLRHYYLPYTTGFSVAYSIFLIIVILGGVYFDYQRYINSNQRKETVMIYDDNRAHELPPIAGAGYVFPSSLTTTVTSAVNFYKCSNSINTTFMASSCTALTSVACSTLSGSGNDASANGQMDAYGIQCSDTSLSIQSNSDRSGSVVLLAEVVFTGSGADIDSLLSTYGGSYFLAVQTARKGNNQVLVNADTTLLRRYEPSSSKRVNVKVEYDAVQQNQISRLSFDYSSEQHYVYTGANPHHITSYTTTLNNTASSTDTISVVGLQVVYKTGIFGSFVQVGDRLFIDNLIRIAGFIFFLFLLGGFVRLYNRASYRYGRECQCTFCGLVGVSQRNQLFGSDGELLSNISYGGYLENFFSRLFEPTPVGDDMLYRIEDEYEKFDTWTKTKQIRSKIEHLEKKIYYQVLNKQTQVHRKD